MTPFLGFLLDDVIDIQDMAPLILWPVDLIASQGICYGWKRPLVCVAGVLPTEDRTVSNSMHRLLRKDVLNGSLKEACRILTSSLARSEWAGVRHMFSSDPSILGYCRPSSGGRSPELSLDDNILNSGTRV